jgi:hypothetical protein
MAGVSLENRVKKPIVSMNNLGKSHYMLISKSVASMLRISDGDIMLISNSDDGLFIATKPLTASKKVGALMRCWDDSGSLRGYCHACMKDIDSGLYDVTPEPMYKGGIDWFEITKIESDGNER